MNSASSSSQKKVTTIGIDEAEMRRGRSPTDVEAVGTVCSTEKVPPAVSGSPGPVGSSPDWDVRIQTISKMVTSSETAELGESMTRLKRWGCKMNLQGWLCVGKLDMFVEVGKRLRV